MIIRMLIYKTHERSHSKSFSLPIFSEGTRVFAFSETRQLGERVFYWAVFYCESYCILLLLLCLLLSVARPNDDGQPFRWQLTATLAELALGVAHAACERASRWPQCNPHQVPLSIHLKRASRLMDTHKYTQYII